MTSIKTSLLDSCVAVVLAAGKGTRMKTDMPKVAVPLLGKPMIVHVLDHLEEAGFKRAVIVVGHKKEEVIRLAEGRSSLQCDFVEQSEQRGTGHAVLCAESSLASHNGTILVTCGDMPMIRASTFQTMLSTHELEKNSVTVLSSVLEKPFGYGRLVRDTKGQLERIVEEKDATDEIRKIREVNAGSYVFPCPQVFDILKNIGSQNSQNEYYLPDVVSLSRARGLNVGSVQIGPIEATGVNSPEELQRLEEESTSGAVAGFAAAQSGKRSD
ncbi:MAG: NTP transferase domain-containing protein [Spirochaetia bacterium]|nr:NTP transferase domain-containing protein [Spirochaetia bacterium]